MFRSLVACAATAAATAGITAGVSSGSRPSNMVKTIDVAQTAIFAGEDLICVNEPASGAPRFKTAGVACSSYAKPYSGIGVWLTHDRVVITRPPNMKSVAVYRR